MVFYISFMYLYYLIIFCSYLISLLLLPLFIVFYDIRDAFRVLLRYFVFNRSLFILSNKKYARFSCFNYYESFTFVRWWKKESFEYLFPRWYALNKQSKSLLGKIYFTIKFYYRRFKVLYKKKINLYIFLDIWLFFIKYVFSSLLYLYFWFIIPKKQDRVFLHKKSLLYLLHNNAYRCPCL